MNFFKGWGKQTSLNIPESKPETPSLQATDIPQMEAINPTVTICGQQYALKGNTYVCLEPQEIPCIYFSTQIARDIKMQQLNEKHGEDTNGVNLGGFYELGVTMAKDNSNDYINVFGIAKGTYVPAEIITPEEPLPLSVDLSKIPEPTYKNGVPDSFCYYDGEGNLTTKKEDPYGGINTKLQQWAMEGLPATTVQALVWGIPKPSKETEEGDLIVAHLFGGPYDLWVKDYNPETKEFFGFASFGGLDDDCAEWGYVHLSELTENNIERDYWWKPKSFAFMKAGEPEDEPVVICEQRHVDIDTDEQVGPTVTTVGITHKETDLPNKVDGCVIEPETHQEDLLLEMEGPEAVVESRQSHMLTKAECIEWIKKRWEGKPTETIPLINKDVTVEGGNSGPNGSWFRMQKGNDTGYKSGITFQNSLHSTDEGYVQFHFSWLDVWDIFNNKQASLDVDVPSDKTKSRKRKATPTTDEDKSFSPAVEEQPKQIPQRTYEPKARYEIIDRPAEISVRQTLNALCMNAGPEQSFNSYSGNGKLHDVVFNETASFHDYTKAKQEFELGQFYTPDWLCRDIVKLCEIPNKVNVLDPTCGTGRFFNWVPEGANIMGIEMDDRACEVAKAAFGRGNIWNWSFTSYVGSRRETQSYIVGNPPFNILFSGHYDHPLATDTDEEDGGKGNLLSQNHFIKCCEYYLEQGGVAAFIVPDTFLEEELKHKKVNQFIDENFWRIATIRLPIDTFKEYQIKFPTKVLVLMKKSYEIQAPDMPQVETTFEDFYKTEMGQWFYKVKKHIDFGQARREYNTKKAEALIKHNLLSLKDKLLKAIYEYKRSPNCKDDKLDEYRLAYATAIKERDTEEAINALSKLTRDIVRATKHKHNPELFIKIYPSHYHINFQRSNATVSEYVNSELKQEGNADNGYNYNLPNRISKNDYVLNARQRFDYEYWLGILNAKKHFIMYKGEMTEIKIINEVGKNYLKKLCDKYELNSTPTDKLKDKYDVQYEVNLETLEDLRFDGKTLLPHQKEDLAAMLMKDYALISWDTGLGKTLGGIAYTYLKGGRTLVLAPAVNTIDPWKQQLTQYVPDRSVFLCKTTKDIAKYKGEDYLICSIEGVPNIYEHLLRWKFNNLILDESDNIKSKASTRAKAIKAIAKRIKRKILMSGTPTRNNILEIYNQVELLCRNSVNMVCWAETWYEYDRSSREYDECRNPNYEKPFPAWGGHKAFERTFSPRKVTCFGANETNQDILNSDAFKKFIEPVRFTRVYDIEKPRINEILGIEDTGAYKEWKQVIVPMSEHEGKVYEFILDEFAKQVEEHYRAIHDGSTASKLVIMRQILELLQGTSHPWTYLGYDGPKEGTKLLKAIEIIEQAKADGKKVMIASPWVDTANAMQEACDSRGYPTFRITTEMSKQKRAKLVHDFRNFPGFAVITGTMGCLKSGLNLPEVSVVIAESYPWNWSQLYQYAARAIRLNSSSKTDIYCLCSEGSFDVNVFRLLVKKEVVNRFVRTSDISDISEITSELGSEDDMMGAALEMVRERIGGRMRGTIKWDRDNFIS